MLMPIPDVLGQIPQPPKQLFCKGEAIEDLLKLPRLAVVGSRKITPYGRQVTRQIVTALAERGIVIVSGLAFGVDYEAHRAAIDAGGKTIAVLPGPIDKVVPRTHHKLAQEIVAKGGVLISEYPSGSESLKGNFVERNRLVSGLSDVVLITEAAERSGSLHTADFAIQQGRDVLAVPGNITSKMSAGTNKLIKDGATPILSASDVLYAMNLDQTQLKLIKPKIALNEAEQEIVRLLESGLTDGDEILSSSALSVSEFSQTITMLELTGAVQSLGPNTWTLT